MKRDIELIKQILLRVEESDGWTEIEGDADELYNAALAIEAGLLRGSEPVRFQDGRMAMIAVERLTNAGHDFLDASRNESAWNAAKGYIAKGGSWTLGLVIDIMKRVAADQIGQHLNGVS